MTKKNYPKVFSTEGQEELGALIAKGSCKGEVFEFYLEESEHNYILKNITYLGGIVGNSKVITYKLLGRFLSLLPPTKEYGLEILTDIERCSKKTITTGSVCSQWYKKDNYNKEELVERYINRFFNKDNRELAISKLKYVK